MSFAIAASVIGVGIAAYGVKSQAKAKADQEKLQKILSQTPRQRTTQLNTKLIPKLEAALAKAQASGDAKKIQNAQDKLLDAQDEAALVAQTANEQHALASGALFEDLNAPASSLTLSSQKKNLLIAGAGLALVIGVAAVAARKRK